MREVIILSNNHLQFKAFFAPAKKELKNLYTKIRYVSGATFSETSNKIQSELNLVIVDYDLLGATEKSLDELCSKIKGSIVLAANFQTLGDKEWSLRELCSQSELIAGVIDTARDIQFCYPLLRSIIRRWEVPSKGHLTTELMVNLNGMVAKSLTELQRLKKIHEQIVPLRVDKIKGLEIFSKFAAGESAGGEFFDIIKKDKSLVLLLTSSKSYVSSSIILSHFEVLREEDNLKMESLELFLENLSQELKSLDLINREAPELLQVLVLKFDLQTMRVNGFHFGESEIISNMGFHKTKNDYPVDEVYFEKAYFEYQLKRGEKLAIISPGIYENGDQCIGEKKIDAFVLDSIESGGKAFLNEAFYQMKKNRVGDFLKHDASIFYIEVDKNVILEI